MKVRPNYRTGPFDNDEINRLRALAADPTVEHGAIQRLADELQRPYISVYRSSQSQRQAVDEQTAAIRAIPRCAAMIHSGETYAALITRLRAEPMPRPDHGQS